MKVTSDHMLATAGFTAALTSVAFAGYMITRDAHAPYVVGVQYFSIFAQPNRSVAARSSRPAAATETIASEGLDFTPTGAIPSDMSAHRSSDQRPQLVGVDGGHAWLQTGSTYSEVGVGDEIPHLGRVRDIEKINGVWTLRMADGALIRARDDLGPTRFDRRLIFDR